MGDNSLLSAVKTYKYDIKDTNGIWKNFSSPIKLLLYPWKDASYNVELHRVTVKMYAEMKIELKRQTYIFFQYMDLGIKFTWILTVIINHFHLNKVLALYHLEREIMISTSLNCCLCKAIPEKAYDLHIINIQ